MSKVIKRFTITGAGRQRDSWQLLGLEIEQTEQGFDLVLPRRVLATTQLVNLDPTNGKPIINFDVKNYLGWDWKINAYTDRDDQMSGSWSNNNFFAPIISATAEDDNWVATGGGTGDEGEEEARSASAY